MSSTFQQNVYTFKADGVIPKGSAVKAGSDNDHVAIGAANTNRCLGIAQSASTAAEDAIEVAVPGGGAKALLGETVAAGDDLCSHTDGSLVKVNLEGDQILARALEGGDAGELISVHVYFATAHAGQ